MDLNESPSLAREPELNAVEQPDRDFAVLVDERREFDTREPLGTFVVKVASRCNLACTYCYMYQHPDQTWREQPVFISRATVDLLASRLVEYTRDRDGIRWLTVVAHGGEPLLLGADRLDQFFSSIREALEATGVKANLGLQTNALLVDDDIVAVLQGNRVHAGVSLDGPAEINDHHRVDHAGGGTFARALAGIEKLRRPSSGDSVFGGILALANPDIPARQCFDTFQSLDASYIDFLLPDYNHDTFPFERYPAGVFGAWLIEMFDLWIASRSKIEIRTFSVMMRLLLGSRYGYDSYGARARGVVVIETDGSIHGLDVLKTAYHGATRTGLHLRDTRFADLELTLPAVALSSKAVVAPEACLDCDLFSVCGGGYLPHRFSRSGGFRRPSVYCRDLDMLIRHIRDHLDRELSHLPQWRERVGTRAAR